MKREEEELIEEIIKMIRQIKDTQSIKMLYGFVKGLKERGCAYQGHTASFFTLKIPQLYCSMVGGFIPYCNNYVKNGLKHLQ